MVCLRRVVVLICLGFCLGLAAPSHAQSLPDASRQTPVPAAAAQNNGPAAPAFSRDQTQAPATPPQPASTTPKPGPKDPVDANGNLIPIERREPQRILGFMPNFRTVSGGSKPHPPGWKYNFTVATTRPLTTPPSSSSASPPSPPKALDEHPALGKGDRRLLRLHLARLPRQDRQHLPLRLAAAQHPS